MSIEIARDAILVPTQLGAFVVTHQYVVEYDVEDAIRNKAESQAQLLKMVHLGNELQGNPNFPDRVMPTVFKDAGEALIEE